MWKHQFLSSGILLCGMVSSIGFARAQASSGTEADEKIIRDIIQEEAVTWTRGDAVTYSRHFAEDGLFTNVLGQYFVGHDAFLRQHDFIFKGIYRGTTLKLDVVSFKFVRPDIAVVHALSCVTGFQTLPPGLSPDNKGRMRTRLVQVLAKQNGRWEIIDYHNVDVKAQTSVPEPDEIEGQ